MYLYIAVSCQKYSGTTKYVAQERGGFTAIVTDGPRLSFTILDKRNMKSAENIIIREMRIFLI